MECSHSQISQTLGTLQTQSHSIFLAHGMQPLTNLTNTWDLGLYRLSLTVHFELMK